MQQALRIVNLPVPNTNRFHPPTVEEVISYGKEVGLPEFECVKMFHYYTANGWHVGRAKMKVWRSAVSGWKLRWEEREKRYQARCSTPTANVKLIKHGEELKRVEAEMKRIRGMYWTDNNGWDSDAGKWRKKHSDLAIRKYELLKLLGMSA